MKACHVTIFTHPSTSHLTRIKYVEFPLVLCSMMMQAHLLLVALKVVMKAYRFNSTCSQECRLLSC